MSSPGPGSPAPVVGGPRSLRVAARLLEAVWFVGVPISLVFVFRLPFAETVGVFVVWLVVLIGIDRFASAHGTSNGGRGRHDGAAP